MNKIKNPHDKYFRSSMRDLRVAKSFLQAHLPPALQQQIRWDSLQLESEQHFDRFFTQTTSDILYRVQFGKAPGFISILIEHQSTVDRLMPFRLLHYCINIMRRYLKSHPSAHLPLVVPIVFYSGEVPYTASTDLFTLFGLQETLARETFLKPFQLIDLGRISDDDLKTHAWASVLELVQKHKRSMNFMEYLKGLIPQLKYLMAEQAYDYLMDTLYYIWGCVELDDPTEFVRLLETEVSDEMGGKVMTLAEVCRRQGLEEGRREAKTLAEVCRQQGLQEGLEEARREAKTLAEVYRQQGLQEGLEEARREAKTLAEVYRQQGLQEGQSLTKRQIAERLIERGSDLEFVSAATGLTLEELALISEK